MIRKARSHNCMPIGEFPSVFNLTNWQSFYGLYSWSYWSWEWHQDVQSFTARFWTFWFVWVFFYNNIDSFWRPFSWKFLGKWHAREREKQIASPSGHFSFSLLQTAQLNHGSLEEENRSAASIFLWEQCLCLFQRWFTVFPIHIINTTIQKLKLCFILKIGQYLYR